MSSLPKAMEGRDVDIKPLEDIFKAKIFKMLNKEKKLMI
jgi:hypothetical protein